MKAGDAKTHYVLYTSRKEAKIAILGKTHFKYSSKNSD